MECRAALWRLPANGWRRQVEQRWQSPSSLLSQLPCCTQLFVQLATMPSHADVLVQCAKGLLMAWPAAAATAAAAWLYCASSCPFAPALERRYRRHRQAGRLGRAVGVGSARRTAGNWLPLSLLLDANALAHSYAHPHPQCRQLHLSRSDGYAGLLVGVMSLIMLARMASVGGGEVATEHGYARPLATCLLCLLPPLLLRCCGLEVYAR